MVPAVFAPRGYTIEWKRRALTLGQWWRRRRLGWRAVKPRRTQAGLVLMYRKGPPGDFSEAMRIWGVR